MSDTSVYPDALDTIATDKTNSTPTGGGDHANHHDLLASAVNKLERELGLAPSGAAATVTARLAGVDTTLAAKADLVGGKVPTAQLPAIAITSVSVVASQAAQLALTAQEGDVAVRSDQNKSYVHNAGSAGTMADWTELATPTDAVLSVAGKTGAVSLVVADVSGAAPLASPAFTGSPTAPTKTPGDNSTKLATTAYVDAAAGTKQPLDSDLTALAALATTSFGRALLELADAAAGRTALGLGTAATHAHGDYDAAGAAAAAQAASQPLDSDLTALAALSTTSFGRALLELADAAAGRAALGLGTAATHAHGDYDTAGAAAAAQAASQPLDSDLTSIAALTTTSFGRSLLELADAAAGRTALAAAPLASPTFTGDPKAPTPAVGDNDTSVATTAFVQDAVATASAGVGSPNTQTANYTLALADAGKLVEMNSATAKVVTVPPNSSVAFAIGTIIEVNRYGAGAVSIAAGAGVTIRSNGAKLGIANQYSSVSLRKRATDEWVLVGDLV